MASESAAAKTSARVHSIGGMALTELWERFSFYGLQSILSFYLLYELDQGGLALSPAASAGIVGAYGGAVYIAQLIGAWLGERVLSPKRLVLIGGIVIAFGHIALAVVAGLPGLAVGLVLIILGTGALKTNITSIVGFILEDETLAIRDAGFSYFYMAINTGSVIGPLATGFVQEEWGFHPGFALAAVGMIAAVIQYVFSSRRLPKRADQVTRPLSPRVARTAVVLTAAAIAVVGIAAWSGLLRAEMLSTVATVVAVVAAAAYFAVMLTSKKVTATEKRRVASFIPLFFVSGLYFGFLFQKFTAVSILIQERVDRSLGDWSFPVGWVSMFSPLAAVLAAPLIASLWTKMGSRQPGAAAKYSIGSIQIGVGFFFLLVISAWAFQDEIPVVLILIFMAIMGSSENFVGPIGLALATQIAPKAFTAQMVAVNFLTLALGSSLSGLLGQLYAAIPNSAYFVIIGASAVLIGVCLLLVRRPLQRSLYAGLS